MFPEACFVKMYYFAIAFQIEIPYHLAPPQGWEAVWIFENLAARNWQSAISQTKLPPPRAGVPHDPRTPRQIEASR